MSKTSRILLLILLSFCFHQTSFCQTYFNPDAVTASKDESKFYWGIASGLESFTGFLGLSLEANVAKKVSIYGGAGLGGWGYKFSGGVKIYRSYPYKWAYCISLSQATGIKDFKTKMETQSGGTQEVHMDLLPCGAFNVTAQHHWNVGQNKNRFNVEFGISIGLKTHAYTIKNGVVLSPASETTMAILQPGGLVAGLGFTFGK